MYIYKVYAVKMCKFDKLNSFSVVHGKGAAFFLQHFPSLYCAPICSLPVTSRCHYYYSFCDITYVVPNKVTENYVIICISGYYECKWNKCYFDWKSSVSRFWFLLKLRTLWKTEGKVNLIDSYISGVGHSQISRFQTLLCIALFQE